jgi:hypothetical protein
VFQDGGGVFRQNLLDAKCCRWRHLAVVQEPFVGGTFLASHDEPAVSDVPQLGQWTSGWQSGQVGQTIDALSFCNQRNKLTSRFLIWTSALSWSGMDLEISIACSAVVSHDHTGNPNFYPQWWYSVQPLQALIKGSCWFFVQDIYNPFSWWGIQTLPQLKHNSSALIRFVTTSFLVRKVHTCTYRRQYSPRSQSNLSHLEFVVLENRPNECCEFRT